MQAPIVEEEIKPSKTGTDGKVGADKEKEEVEIKDVEPDE
jgi:hypothetical protein